jgi:hypothetical protein
VLQGVGFKNIYYTTMLDSSCLTHWEKF